MYLERIAVSEFASRLSNTDIHSFEGVLYLLQEYEVGIGGCCYVAVDYGIAKERNRESDRRESSS